MIATLLLQAGQPAGQGWVAQRKARPRVTAHRHRDVEAHGGASSTMPTPAQTTTRSACQILRGLHHRRLAGLDAEHLTADQPVLHRGRQGRDRGPNVGGPGKLVENGGTFHRAHDRQQALLLRLVEQACGQARGLQQRQHVGRVRPGHHQALTPQQLHSQPPLPLLPDPTRVGGQAHQIGAPVRVPEDASTPSGLSRAGPRSFEQPVVRAPLGERVGRGQTDDSRADHHDLGRTRGRVAHLRLRRRCSSAPPAR